MTLARLRENVVLLLIHARLHVFTRERMYVSLSCPFLSLLFGYTIAYLITYLSLSLHVMLFKMFVIGLEFSVINYRCLAITILFRTADRTARRSAWPLHAYSRGGWRDVVPCWRSEKRAVATGDSSSCSVAAAAAAVAQRRVVAKRVTAIRFLAGSGHGGS